jgi:tRNA(Ile)-lysidine synthase
VQAAETKQVLSVGVHTMDEYQSLLAEKSGFAAFDADAMKAVYGEDFLQRIRLATREAGDTIAIGDGKRKKLQDYFVDRKIPRDEREKIHVVKIGHDVLWVPPYQGKGRFCSNFKLCPNTKKVISIEIICVL